MRIKISSSDLTDVLSQVSMASGGTAGDISNYLLFRPLDNTSFEVLAHSTHTFASAQVSGKANISGGSDSFLVEGGRLLQFLTAAGSGEITLWGDEKGVKVQTAASRKPVCYPSQAVSKWPFLDDQIKDLKETAAVNAGDLAACLEHVRQFVYPDTKEPAFNLTESRDGYFISSNKVVGAMTVLEGLQGSNLRILKADIGAVLSWLSRVSDDTKIQIQEGEQFLCLVRPDGAILGVNRPLMGFPSPFLTPSLTATNSILIPRDKVLTSLKILVSAADKKDTDRIVTVRASGKLLTLEMDGASGEVNDQEIILESDVPEGYPEFQVLDGMFQKVLEQQKSGNLLSMGYLHKGRGGMTIFREKLGNVEYITAQAWYLK